MERAPRHLPKRLALFAASLAFTLLPSSRIEPKIQRTTPAVAWNYERPFGYPPECRVGTPCDTEVITSPRHPDRVAYVLAQATEQPTGVDCSLPVLFGTDPEGNPIPQDPENFVACGKNAEQDPSNAPTINPGRIDPTLS